MYSQTIFPSSSFRNEFPTLDTAKAYINRVSPVTWAIVADASGNYLVTSEGHATCLVKQGYVLIQSLNKLNTEFKSWLEQLKAEIVRINPAYTSAMLRDRMFVAGAYANFSIGGLSIQQAASPYTK